MYAESVPPFATKLLTAGEAASYLSIKKSTLYTWRSRRPGYGPPAVMVGGALRYRRTDLDDWLQAHSESFAKAEPQAPDSAAASLTLLNSSQPRLSGRGRSSYSKPVRVVRTRKRRP